MELLGPRNRHRGGNGDGNPVRVPVKLVILQVFIVLWFPAIEDRPSATTAFLAGGSAVVPVPLNYNLGRLVGASSGIFVEVYLNR